MELFCRNRELTHFSIVCMVNAGYSETKILSRVAIENVLLMRLFAINPNIADIWFSDPDKFRKEWKPKTVRKAVFAKVSEREKIMKNSIGHFAITHIHLSRVGLKYSNGKKEVLSSGLVQSLILNTLLNASV